MKYDLVCFDVDGTLVNTFPFIIYSYKKIVMDKYGEFKETEKDIKAQIGMPIKYFFANYPEEDRTFLQDEFARFNDDLQSKGVPFFDGVLDALKELKKHVKIGIVTSKRKIPLMDWLKQVDLDKFFDVIVAKEDTQKHKPNGEPLELAIKKIGTQPNKTLYVGDAVYDLLCAKNAKVKSCLVGWTALTQEEIDANKPDYFIKDAKEILDIIK